MSNLDVPEDDSPQLSGHSQPPTDSEANSRRLRAWMDAGATNVPALLIALGSASFGGVLMLVRKRRRS